MKQYLFLLLLLLLLLLKCGAAFSQSFWQETTPFPKQVVHGSASLAASPTSNYLFVSVEEQGLFRSRDVGGSWEKIFHAPIYTVAARADGVVVAGGIGVMHVSSDQGENWTQYTIASDSPVSKIIFNSKGHIFAGTSDFTETDNSEFVGDGVFRSTDNGKTWEQLNNGLVGSLAVEALAIDSEDRLYLGISDERSGAGGGIYTLLPNETTWARLPVSFSEYTNVKVKYVHAIATDNKSHLYITIGGSYGTAGIMRTLKSEDRGANWRILSLGESPYGDTYDDFAFQTLYMSKTGVLWGWVQSRNGLVYSTNFGESWNQRTAGIGSASTMFIFAETADGQMLALRKYDGNIVYKTANPLHVQEPEPILSLNTYPNPFCEALAITFALETPSAATVTIMDAVGGLKLLQRTAPVAGSQTLHWKPTSLPAGLYFVKLQTGKYSKMQKVVLVR